jgi:hypothetical protein
MGGKQAAPQDPQQAAQQGAAQPQVGGTQTKSHILLMQQAAEDAKQKYMKDNNVDENGDPVAGN